MKKILIPIFIFILILILLQSCVPPVPEPEPEPSPIDCSGYYKLYDHYWGLREIKEAGTYWINPDKRVFKIGDYVSNPVEVFGECPTEYKEELFLWFKE